MGTVSVLYSEIKKTFPELSLDKLLIHGIILILQQTALSFFICSVNQTEQTALDDGLCMHYCPVNY